MKYYLYVCILLLTTTLGCPNRNDHTAMDAEIKRGTDILKKRARFYGHICYRPEAALEKGARMEERNAYVKELLADIEKVSQTDYSEADLARLKSDLEAKSFLYTPEAILKCAQRNFSYVSAVEKKWFEIFDAYGVEPENFVYGIAPLRDELLQSQLIMVGNNHAFGLEQSQILYDLTHYLNGNRHEVVGLLLESVGNGVMEKNLEALRQGAQKSPEVLETKSDKEAWADLSAERFFQAHLGAGNFSLFFFKPRVKAYFRYALFYPEVQLASIDERTINDPLLGARDTGLNLSALQDLMNRMGRSQVWLAFYGEAHTVRMGVNDTTRVEKEVRYQGQKIKTFVISQGAGFLNALIRLTLDLKMKEDMIDFTIEKFSFPKSSSLFQATLSRDFYDVWDQVIDKYNSFKRVHALPIYVNLDAAFQSTEPQPADLAILPPSDNLHNAPFDFEKDDAFLVLKSILNLS